MKMRKPSLRLHKPSKQAVVTIDGKDHYLGRWGSKLAHVEYERLIGEWSANGGVPKAAEQAVTVAELVLAYRKFANTYYAAPSREVAQIRPTLRPLVEKYGHTFARDFGPLALKAVRETWIEG